MAPVYKLRQSFYFLTLKKRVQNLPVEIQWKIEDIIIKDERTPRLLKAKSVLGKQLDKYNTSIKPKPRKWTKMTDNYYLHKTKPHLTERRGWFHGAYGYEIYWEDKLELHYQCTALKRNNDPCKNHAIDYLKEGRPVCKVHRIK